MLVELAFHYNICGKGKYKFLYLQIFGEESAAFGKEKSGATLLSLRRYCQ